MKNETIRRMVRDLFDQIGEVAVAAILRRKTQNVYVPGSVLDETESDVSVRLVRTEKSLAGPGNADGSPIDASLHYALIECESAVPKTDDDLLIGDESFTLLQVIAADTGAGILYEVSYQ
ncbi:hypothetical protein [Sneathiella sp.]|uniref:hypothetical protein n=1 Tax=Sneathiella sp. TaxID=1964365 RepID=UPI003561C2F4